MSVREGHKQFNFQMPDEMVEHVRRHAAKRGMLASHYIRGLVASDMEKNPLPKQRKSSRARL